MKKIIFVLAIASLALGSCKKENVTGDGPVETQQRSVSNFDKVSVSGASQAFISKGDQFSVTVKAYSTLLPYLETRVVNGTLKISYKDDTRIKNDNSVIYITMPRLTAITTAGSGNVFATGNYEGNESFEIKISGSSDINLESGSSKRFNAFIEGSGNIKAFGFSAEEANVKISGSGNTEIAVSKILDVKISGSGNVYYKGDPETVKSDISGSGKVVRQ